MSDDAPHWAPLFTRLEKRPVSGHPGSAVRAIALNRFAIAAAVGSA